MGIKTIYISGKISGLPISEVIHKFQVACAKIKRFGLEPKNPLDNGLPWDAAWEDQWAKIFRYCFDAMPYISCLIIWKVRGHRLSWQWHDNDRCPYSLMQRLPQRTALQGQKN